MVKEIKVNEIIGIVNTNYKEDNFTTVKHKGKTYNIIKFLGMNLKTISFQTDKGNKNFKYKDILNLISL